MRKHETTTEANLIKADTKSGRDLRVGLMTMQKIRLSTDPTHIWSHKYTVYIIQHAFGATNVHDGKAQANDVETCALYILQTHQNLLAFEQ